MLRETTFHYTFISTTHSYQRNAIASIDSNTETIQKYFRKDEYVVDATTRVEYLT